MYVKPFRSISAVNVYASAYNFGETHIAIESERAQIIGSIINVFRDYARFYLLCSAGIVVMYLFVVMLKIDEIFLSLGHSNID